jgi:hypothetical protein
MPVASNKQNGRKSQSMEDNKVKIKSEDEVSSSTRNPLAVEHLPPIILSFLILVCSGTLCIFSLRDLLATGKNVGGSWDEALLVRQLIEEYAVNLFLKDCFNAYCLMLAISEQNAMLTHAFSIEFSIELTCSRKCSTVFTSFPF